MTLSGEAPIEARPTIVEFSPYGRNTRTSLFPGLPGSDIREALG